MKKWQKTLLVIAIISITYGSIASIFYLKINNPTVREKWRLTEHSVFNSVSVNDLLIFDSPNFSLDCDCIYAINQITGDVQWDTEELAKPYIKPYFEDFILSVNTNIEATTTEMVIITLYARSDEKRYLFALDGDSGEVIWGYEVGIDSILFDKNTEKYLFIVEDSGDLVALEINTGEELWRQNLDINENGEFGIIDEVYQNTLIIRNLFSECDSCLFKVDKTRYHQFEAYNMETGKKLWESNFVPRGRTTIKNENLFVVSDPWETHPKYRDDLVVTLNLNTGEKIWDDVFQDADEMSVETTIYGDVVFLTKTYAGGFSDFHKMTAIRIVDGNNWETKWEFNSDFLHGDLGYLSHDETFYIGAEDGYVYALENSSGKVIWEVETGGFPLEFIIRDNILVAIHKEAFVSGVDLKTGALMWHVDIGIDDRWASLDIPIKAYDENRLYVAGNHNQKVYAIDIKTGDIAWTWDHFRLADVEYEIVGLEDETLYVSQNPKSNIGPPPFMPFYFSHGDWLFALETSP